MNFELVKKNSAYKKFASDVDNGRVSHAYIVYGEDGDLRKSFLTLACMKLLCKSACGECRVCTQVLEGNYVEILRLDGADKPSVKDISALIEKTYVKCVVGDKKIAVIDNAELLSPQAQNKLLKTYEEPPANLTVFLGAAHESGLLATLRSRGKKLYLEDIPKADKFCNETDYRDLYDKTFMMMAELKKSSSVPEYVYGGLFEKERIKITLDFMEIILCDIMKKVTGSKAPNCTVNREYDLARASEGFTEQSAAAAVIAVNDARKKLAANVNAYSVAGYMLLEILEAKYKWQKK